MQRLIRLCPFTFMIIAVLSTLYALDLNFDIQRQKSVCCKMRDKSNALWCEMKWKPKPNWQTIGFGFSVNVIYCMDLTWSCVVVFSALHFANSLKCSWDKSLHLLGIPIFIATRFFLVFFHSFHSIRHFCNTMHIDSTLTEGTMKAEQKKLTKNYTTQLRQRVWRQTKEKFPFSAYIWA